MAKAATKTKKQAGPDFSFFQEVKTGDRFADNGKVKEIKEWIDTGSYAFNALISGDLNKGFPSNRVLMLAGEQAVGKTFFAIYGFCRPLVEKGYFIFYVDTENAVDDQMLLDFGLPKGSFKIITQDIVENLKENFDTILTQLETAMGTKKENPNKCAFVIDSQGMLDTLKSRKDIKESNHVADFTFQKELKRLYKSIMIRMGILDIPMLVTNHVYANIGGYGDPTKIAGGSGGLYASTVILHLRKKQYKEGTIRKGTVITAKNAKSRITLDGMEASVYLSWTKGLNKWYGLHEIAEQAGLIDKWSSKDYDKKGVVGPEKTGNYKGWYVIKDPKLEPSQWIVCKDIELHCQSKIGTIFDEINEYVKESYKLKKPIDFMYDDDEDEDKSVEIESSKLVDAETVESKALKNGKIQAQAEEDLDDSDYDENEDV